MLKLEYNKGGGGHLSLYSDGAITGVHIYPEDTGPASTHTTKRHLSRSRMLKRNDIVYFYN